MRYVATIIGNDIARARRVGVGNDLHVAKELALAEFSDGFKDHEIVIYDTRDCEVGYDQAIVWRKII